MKHQVKWRRVEPGHYLSACERWRVLRLDNMTRPQPNHRCVVLDMGTGAEVFAGRILREAKAAAQRIADADAGADPRAAARQAAGVVLTLALGGVAAWDPGACVLVNLASIPEEAEWVAAIRAEEARRMDLELSEIEAELDLTDADAPELPDSVRVDEVTTTRREPVRDRRWLRAADEIARLIVERAPALRPPVPCAWVDLQATLYTPDHAEPVRVACRVYIRDTDTERDVWRRCKHALRAALEDHHGQHPQHDREDTTRPEAPAQAARPVNDDHGAGDRPGRPGDHA